MTPEQRAEDRERWLGKVESTVIEAIGTCGASQDEVMARVQAGIAEGLRLAELRRPATPPTTAPVTQTMPQTPAWFGRGRHAA